MEEIEKVGLSPLIHVLAHADEARLKVIEVLEAPVLVADADVFELEGFGVAHVGTHLRPMRFVGVGGRDVTLCKEDEIGDVIDDFGLEFARPGHDALIARLALLAHTDLAQKPAVEHGERRHLQIFAQAEVLVKADAVRLHVAPHVGDLLALFERPHRVSPLILILEGDVALDDAAAGEAEEGRMAVLQYLDKAGRELAVAILIGIAPRHCREQGDVIDTDLAVAFENDAKAPHRVLFGNDGSRDFDPVAVGAFGDGDLADRGMAAVRALDEHLRGALEAEALDEHGEVVCLAVLDGHAVHIIAAHRIVAGIFEVIDAAHAQKQKARVVLIHAANGHDLLGACTVDVPGVVALLARFDGAFCIEVVVGEVLELERIVDHHLGIHAAVRRLIDVLEEQSVEVLGNVNAPLVRVQCVIEHKSYNISLRVSRCLRTGPPPDLRHYYNR